MKRTLFTLTAVCASALGFAQTPAGLVSGQFVKQPAPVMVKADYAKSTAGVKANSQHRSVANGNYYTVPTGSMNIGYNKEGMGYSVALVNTQAFTPAVFQNMNANPMNATWMWNGNPAADMGLVDENNNFVWQGFPIETTSEGLRSYAAPTLVGQADSYTLPSSNGGSSALVSMAEIAPLTFTDPHMATQIYGSSQFMSTQYLFGSGVASITDAEGNPISATVYAVAQDFPAPMSPLYVEDVHLMAISADGNNEPLKNGATLTMTIVGESGNQIAQLTATADDLTPIDDGNMPPYGYTYIWTLTFSNKVADPIFGEIAEPFVINEPFTVLISGFDNQDIDLGFYGFTEDTSIDYPFSLSAASLVATVASTGESTEIRYADDIAIPMTFSALMDNVRVESTLYYSDGNGGSTQVDHTNVIRIPEDGSLGYMEATGEGGAYVYTATNWDGGYYNVEVLSSSDGDAENWLGTAEVDNSQWESNPGLNLVSFTATPIDANQGRWAIVNITGRGVTSANPIIILQGTATYEDVVASGIENVVAGSDVKADPNAPVYNLNGQRVTKATKGILIQNGKKFINK